MNCQNTASYAAVCNSLFGSSEYIWVLCLKEVVHNQNRCVHEGNLLMRRPHDTTDEEALQTPPGSYTTHCAEEEVPAHSIYQKISPVKATVITTPQSYRDTTKDAFFSAHNPLNIQVQNLSKGKPNMQPNL